MRQSAYFQPDMKGYQQGCSFVESFFQKAGIRGKEKARAMLIVDEAVGSLYEHRSGTEDRMHVRASKWFGNTTIELSMRGNAYDLSEEIASATLSDEEEISQETQSVIRNILLRSKAEDLTCSHIFLHKRQQILSVFRHFKLLAYLFKLRVIYKAPAPCYLLYT